MTNAMLQQRIVFAGDLHITFNGLLKDKYNVVGKE
uniref:Uncharacterized protein n=1 Tax=viral metagenome TaxID=1070528 RepID=A0A6C0C843_9ZZZZ